MEDLWTTAEVARFMRVSPVAVRNWIASGDLKATKLPGRGQGRYRIAPEVVRELIERQGTTPTVQAA
jgi:excisionase family DNA binding protein